MTPKYNDAPKEFNNNLKLLNTAKEIFSITLHIIDIVAKQTDLKLATIYFNNNNLLLLKPIINNTSIKASNKKCNLIGEMINDVSKTTISGFKQHSKQSDKTTTARAVDTKTISSRTSEGGKNINDNDDFLHTKTHLMLVNEQLKTISNDVSKGQQKMETNLNENDNKESLTSRIMLVSSPHCVSTKKPQHLCDNREVKGEFSVTVKPSLLQNFNNCRLGHKNITIKPFSDSNQRTVDLETSPPNQCELLELNYTPNKDLLEIQADCIKTTLAERKALLKKEFFKDLTELQQVTTNKNACLNKRLLKKQYNLKLKIPKESIKQQKELKYTKETHENNNVSLVALRKLDLQKKNYHTTLKKELEKPILYTQFPRVKDLAKKFDFPSKMIVPQTVSTPNKTEVKTLKTHSLEQRHSPMSDEGCNLGQSPYSSDDDNDSIRTTNTAIERIPGQKRKDKVARSASSDSALGLEVDEPMDISEPQQVQKRRMTLTVTDLPLRPALLPLAEPTLLPDSPTLDTPQNVSSYLQQTQVPTKVLLEERLIEIPEDPKSGVSSRRESSQSSFSDYPASEIQGVRFVRTPSVVVSDYSDDITCGITLEEIEYFRAQRLRRRRSSLDTAGAEKEALENTSDISASSSCSNLYYCGSTISALDGAECLVNGVRLELERKTSDCSNYSISGDEDCSPSNFTIPEQPEDCQDITDMLANQHLSNKRSKKVGIPAALLSVDNPNFV